MTRKAGKARHKSKTGRADATGRWNGPDRHVRLYHWLLNCPAWRHLKPNSKVVLLAIWQRHNGFNNGQIAAAERDLRKVTGLNRRTIRSALRDCQDLGFLVCRQPAFFDMDSGPEAALWEITAEPTGQQQASKLFMHWRPPDMREQTEILRLRAQRLPRPGARAAPDSDRHS